jgi:hypothetical protein
VAICDGDDDIVQLVDRIAEPREVLADFNNEPLFYSGWSATPPADRQQRVIEFDLNVTAQADMDAVATALQPAMQYISRGDVWLMFQRSTASEPVFFRIRPSDVTSIVEMWTVAARSVHLALQADAYARGLLVEHTFEITNDPSASGPDVNPMRYRFTDPIQGDVPTPAWVSFPTADETHQVNIASVARIASLATSGLDYDGPYWKGLADAPIAADTSDWTFTDTADTGTIGGTRRRVEADDGFGQTTSGIPTAAAVLEWPDLPMWRWRAFIRVRGESSRGTAAIWNQSPLDGSALTDREAATQVPTESIGTQRDWLDAGVVALPGASPGTNPVYGLEPGPVGALYNVGLIGDAIGTGFSLDALLLIPAGGHDIVTRHTSASFPEGFTGKEVVCDGINGRWYAVGTSTAATGLSEETTIKADTVGGSLPVLVPNAVNDLYVLNNVSNEQAGRPSDDKTMVTEVTCRYYPLYLNDRPSST